MDGIPLSSYRETDDLVFASGNGPFDPNTGEIETDDVREQTVRTLENIEAVLEEAGVGLDDVVKTTVFITDAGHYEPMNEGYASVMGEPYPARSVVVTGIVTEGQHVEIEAIAEK